ncbi:TetR/AcrR family transcriptional regulator [Kutzneria buriramensis]|uniref:AcrR family transcriptional regulator n=1 Tax=Kutzneria buriramensis TaxID=1045776 RepID=A0A3E0H098_9PSEU|nr:TetR family transcriptional regulator [Kutzneria buriramensis]REH36219.1 AcrR family transcriptional regulator [Kutzneria buriramensis]
MSGLRERKKQATREALSWAALSLAVERGLDNVLVEDIANAAGVSPRTFNNYFSSKYEAITSRAADRIHRVGEVLLDRPADEPLWDAITAAVLAVHAEAGSVPQPEWLAGLRPVLSAPAMSGELLKSYVKMRQALTDAIAARLGEGDHGMYPEILAAAVAAATQVASDHWLRADPPVPLLGLLETALEQLRGIR